MGLTMSKTTESGIQLNEAYLKVENVSGNKETQNVILCTYASMQTCEQGKVSIEQHYYTFSPSVEDGAPNFIKQAYEHIKNLQEYQTALDS